MNSVIVELNVRDSCQHSLLADIALVGFLFVGTATVGLKTRGEALELHDIGGQSACLVGEDVRDLA